MAIVMSSRCAATKVIPPEEATDSDRSDDGTQQVEERERATRHLGDPCDSRNENSQHGHEPPQHDSERTSLGEEGQRALLLPAERT
jgi:hypothetical protein